VDVELDAAVGAAVQAVHALDRSLSFGPVIGPSKWTSTRAPSGGGGACPDVRASIDTPWKGAAPLQRTGLHEIAQRWSGSRRPVEEEPWLQLDHKDSE